MIRISEIEIRSISAEVEKAVRRRKGHRWVTPVRKRRSGLEKLLANLQKFFQTFCDNTSIAGYKYLTKPHRPWFERFFWVIIHSVTLYGVVITASGFYIDYLATPVVNVVDSDNYPISNLDFPAVAVCSVNRISRTLAETFATEIIAAKVTNATFDDVMKMIKALGGLYESEVNYQIDRKYTVEVDKLLRDFYGGDYDITETMKRITPNCLDEIKVCLFKANFVNCADIFKSRKTQEGYCCTFNYAREPDDIPTDEEMNEELRLYPRYQIGAPGWRSGLVFLLNPAIDDYYYPILPIQGWKITLFDADDFPDDTSGGVSEILVSPATVLSLQITAMSYYSTEAIRDIPLDKRDCLFHDENDEDRIYTYSDCRVDCRAAVIWKNCRCRLFYLPRRGAYEYSQRICQLSDVPCLEINKIAWWALEPHDEDDDESEEVDFHCHDCYPSCGGTSYYVSPSWASMDPGLYQTTMQPGKNASQETSVSIYFKNNGSVRLKMDLGYYWYELLSNIGGICGVFIGLSLISVVELLYFFLRFIYETCCRRSHRPVNSRRFTSKARRNQMQFVGKLYWNEFVPQSRVKPFHVGNSYFNKY